MPISEGKPAGFQFLPLPIMLTLKYNTRVENIEPGDCIVCFNKQDIYNVSRQLEARGVETAVIYGSLPPNTKLAMAAKFNDPDDPCKVMVATDAVGMGLNLNIRRIVFYSIYKVTWLLAIPHSYRCSQRTFNY